MPLRERTTLDPSDEIRDSLLLEEFLLQDLDSEGLDRPSRNVVVGTSPLTALAPGEAPVDVPAARLRPDAGHAEPAEGLPPHECSGNLPVDV